MSVINSTTPDTLSGYDLVLSLSTEAINAQFEELYNKPIPSERLVKRGQNVKGFRPLPIPKYYISHELNIKYVLQDDESEGNEEFEDDDEGSQGCEGIEGYIECPKLSISKDQKNVAILSIQFKTDMDGDQEKPSRLCYRRRGRLLRTNIAGWTLRWEANICHQPVDDYMKDLVNASKSPNSPTLMTDEAAAELQRKFEGIDASKFMASTVFCSLEDNRYSGGFELLRPDGDRSSIPEHQSIVMQLSSYFKQLGKATENRPTPDTPFILGYGISQRPGTLEGIDSTASSTTTPPFFIPRRFDMSTTPSRSAEAEDYTDGTINFCMQTFRANQNEQGRISPSDGSAGLFDQTFFQKTATKGTAEGDNGIMAFSKQVFNDYWIRSLLDHIDYDPHKISRLLCMEQNVYNPGIEKSTGKVYTRLPEGHGWSLKEEFLTNVIACPNESVYQQRRKAYGEFIAKISYSSDLAGYDEGQRRTPELHRRGFIDIEIKSTVALLHETKGINSILQSFRINEWLSARSAKIISHYRLRFNLVPGAGGTLIVQEDTTHSNLPQDENGIKPDVRGPEGVTNCLTWNIRDADEWGTFIFLSNHNTFTWAGQPAEMDKFKNAAFAANGKDFRTVDDKLQNIFNGLKTTVILPAGNVFAFKGINTDRDGNLCTSVNYRTVSNARRI